MKIFVPQDSTYNKCYVVQSEGVIRGYDRTPSNNTSYNYRDYYINSDYIFRDGNGSWSSYTTLPVCLGNDIITNESWYRLDITNVLINISVVFFFCFYIPFRIFKSLLGRRLL